MIRFFSFVMLNSLYIVRELFMYTKKTETLMA